MTYFERIKNMNIEEFSKFMSKYTDCFHCYEFRNYCSQNDLCETSIKKYLEQEVK